MMKIKYKILNKNLSRMMLTLLAMILDKVTWFLFFYYIPIIVMIE